MKKEAPKQWTRVRCSHCRGTGKAMMLNPFWLRYRRLQAGMSVRAMARHMGISAPYVSDVERGHRRATDAFLVAYGDLPAEPGR